MSQSGSKATWSEVKTASCMLEVIPGVQSYASSEQFFGEFGRNTWIVSFKEANYPMNPTILIGSIEHKGDCQIEFLSGFAVCHEDAVKVSLESKRRINFTLPVSDESLGLKLFLEVSVNFHFRIHSACRCEHCFPALPSPMPSTLLSLSSDFQKLFVSPPPEFCDVIIEVNSVEIPANKAILAARVPYFESLFTSGMKETISGRIKIDDADADCVKQVIKFI